MTAQEKPQMANETKRKDQGAPSARTATHTPGPWEIEPGGDGAFEIHARMPDNNLFNVLCARATWTSAERQEMSMANAKLIAEAPALADALEAALHEAGHACCCEKPHSSVGVSLHESDCWTAKARAALRAAGRLP